MKKKSVVTTFVLGLSIIAGSAYAASNTDMWGSAQSSEPVNLEEMAKQQGITVDELTAQLEKEGKLTKAASVTDSVQAEGTMVSNTAENASGMTNSSEALSLEELAKEQGITVDELKAQLEEESKSVEAVPVVPSIEAK